MIEDRILAHRESTLAHRQFNGPYNSNTLLGQLCNGTILVVAQR